VNWQAVRIAIAQTSLLRIARDNCSPQRLET
jgi:hypothetical protein